MAHSTFFFIKMSIAIFKNKNTIWSKKVTNWIPSSLVGHFLRFSFYNLVFIFSSNGKRRFLNLVGRHFKRKKIWITFEYFISFHLACNAIQNALYLLCLSLLFHFVGHVFAFCAYPICKCDVIYVWKCLWQQKLKMIYTIVERNLLLAFTKNFTCDTFYGGITKQ